MKHVINKVNKAVYVVVKDVAIAGCACYGFGLGVASELGSKRAKKKMNQISRDLEYYRSK